MNKWPTNYSRIRVIIEWNIFWRDILIFRKLFFEFSLIIFQFLDSPKQIPCGSSDWLKARILLQKVFQPIINHTNSYNKSRIQFYICLVIHQVSPNFDSTYLHVTVYSIGRHWVQAQWDEIFLEVAFIFLCFFVLTRYSWNVHATIKYCF